MARQVFLTLATARAASATTAKATAAVHAWLAGHKLRMRTAARQRLGIARQERIAGQPRAPAACRQRQQVRDSSGSLAVAATDGTLQRRFQNGSVAARGLLKTGTLEACARRLRIDAAGRRWIVVRW
jgi:D-alanyl-D-alanine carboxypeptidase